LTAAKLSADGMDGIVSILVLVVRRSAAESLTTAAIPSASRCCVPVRGGADEGRRSFACSDRHDANDPGVELFLLVRELREAAGLAAELVDGAL
jgi:hypothetical protein